MAGNRLRRASQHDCEGQPESNALELRHGIVCIALMAGILPQGHQQ